MSAGPSRPARWKPHRDHTRTAFVVGTLAALGSGLLAIDWLLGYVRVHTYGVFVVYRFVIAALVFLAILSGVREATF